MKNIAKIAVAGALMALGPAQSNAQTTNTVIKSSFTMSGTAYTNGTARMRFTTKEILKAIASELSITLDRKARLELVHIVASSDVTTNATDLVGTFRVRLVNGTTNIDLSANDADLIITNDAGIFNITPTFTLNDIVLTSVKGSTTTDHEILHVSFVAAGVTIEAEGFSTLTSTTSTKGKSERLVCDFAGAGAVNNGVDPALFTGSFSASGGVKDNAIETIP